MNDLDATTDVGLERGSWSDGYVVDVSYVTGFQRELPPSWLASMATLLGRASPDLTAPYRWGELGCGNGLTAIATAALNPDAEVWGFDFDPAAIERAKGLAAETGVDNVRFERMSFRHMAEAPAYALPQFDFLCAHGVLSWIGAEARRDVARVIKDNTAPGGLVCLGYNVDAGWAGLAPAHRLMRLIANCPNAAGARVRTDLAIPEILSFLRTLQDGGAKCFRDTPFAAELIRSLAEDDPKYVAHEHLNKHWTPLSFSDVADIGDAAGLEYLGSASPIENLDDATMPAELLGLIPRIRDRRVREVARDLACGRQFRQDLYQKAGRPLAAGEHEQAVDSVLLAGVGVSPDEAVVVTGPSGPIYGDPALCHPVLQRLLNGPMSLGQMRRLPAFAGRSLAAARRAAMILIAAGMAQPLLPEGAARATCQSVNRFNSIVSRRNGPLGPLTLIGSGRAGSCVGAAQVELLAVGIMAENGDCAPVSQSQLINRVFERMAASGGAIAAGRTRIDEPAAVAEHVRHVVARMSAGRRRDALTTLEAI